MKNTLKSIISPILSLIILLLGNGLFMTYVTVRLKIDDYSNEAIGFVSASFYAGVLVGSFYANRLIERIGHIRAFAGFASLLSVVSLLQGFYISIWSWSILRALNGAMMAGLFITIESWLLVKSTPKIRGKVLAIYMTALYASQSLGQFLLNISDPLSWIPYILIAILTSLSVIPVSLTKAEAPITSEPSYLRFTKLLNISPLGVIGCLLSGVMLGAVYGLAPLYAQEIGLSLKYISLFMSIIIFGGLVLQWPIGHISDYIDRRKILLIVGLLTTATSILIAIFDAYNIYLLFGLVFLFGGFSFTLYPLSISHTCDHLEPKDFVAATGGLMIAYGLGAIIGPLIAPFAFKLLGPKGLFIYFAVISGILALYAFIRLFRLPPIPPEEKLPYANLPRTTPSVGELDPRSENPDNESSNVKNK